MGRGYSASRSKSGRPTLRMKRSRSMSLHALKKNMDAYEAAKTAPHNEEESSSSNTVATAAAEAVPRKVLKVARQRRAPSSAATAAAPAAPTATSKSVDAAKTKKASASKDGRDRSATSSSSGVRRTPSAQFRKNLAELEEKFDDAMEASEDDEETVMNTTTMTKYKECGRVVDAVLELLAAACVPGANTKTLCDMGDEEVAKRLKGLFMKTKDADGKRLSRGLAYPTNVSVNEVLCNDSPYRLEDGTVLKEGDVVKVHLGCHLDGYPVSAARTVVVVTPTRAKKAQKNEEEEGKAAAAPASSSAAAARAASAGNAMEAARVALLTMLHALRPGTLNADITDLVAAVGNHYGVQAVEGVLSNRTKRWVPDGMDCIIGRRVTTEDPHQDVGECEVDEHQVWCLDVAFTNCDSYRITLAENPVTLFRRTPAEFEMDARVKQANEVLQEITDAHFCFPFHFKGLTNPLKAKLGIHVLQKKGMLDKLSPLRTKTNYITARFCATVAITAKRVTVLCGAPPTAPLPAPAAMHATVAEETLPAEVLEVLRRPLEFADARAVVSKKDSKDSSSPAMKRKRVEALANEE